VVSSIRKGKTLSFAKKEVCVPQGRRPWPEMAAGIIQLAPCSAALALRLQNKATKSGFLLKPKEEATKYTGTQRNLKNTDGFKRNRKIV
jgi:hypothetical protein